MADNSAQAAATQQKAKQWLQEMFTKSSPIKSKEIGSLMTGPVSIAGSCSSSSTEETSIVTPIVAWNSSPSVVTWYCVQRVGPKPSSKRDSSTLDEASSANSTRKCSLPKSDQVEPCGECPDMDQGKRRDPQTHKFDLGLNFRKASNYFIAALTRNLSVSKLRISSERAQTAAELRIKFECAKQSLQESEQRFLASESELISTLLSASDALDTAQDVKKKWGWLTMPSKLREIETLKEKVQSVRTELEALRASFSIERAELITIVNDLERQCNQCNAEDVSVESERLANQSNSTEFLDTKRSSSFKNRMMAWARKSKVDSSACSSHTYRSLPSVVTWHLQRSNVQEAEQKPAELSVKIPPVQRSVSKSKINDVLSRILRPYNEAKISTPSATKDFRMLPSVVTWCSPQEMQKAKAAPGCEPSVKLSILSAISPKTPKMSILGRMSQGISSVFSSGSTLSAQVKLKSQSDAKDFRHLPSVVTWLVIPKPTPVYYLVATETAIRNTGAEQLTSNEEVRLIDYEAALPCPTEIAHQGIEPPFTPNSTVTVVTTNQGNSEEDRQITDVLAADSTSTSLPSVVTWHIHKISTSQVTGDARACPSMVKGTPTSGSFMTKMIRSFSYPFSKNKPSIRKVGSFLSIIPHQQLKSFFAG
jgi:hypothetical protein